MKKSILFAFVILSMNVQAAVVTRNHPTLGCKIYEVRNPEVNNEGLALSLVLKDGEKIYAKKGRQHGLSFSDLEVSFDNKSITFVLTKNNAFMFNTPLMEARGKVSARNPLFSKIQKMVNNHMQYVQSLCLRADNEILAFTL